MKIDTLVTDYVTDTPGVLVRADACRPPVWPSEWPPAAHTPGIAPHMLVPLAMASADIFFGRLHPAPGARRDDGGLGSACVTMPMWHRQPQEAIARVSRVVRG